MVAALFFFVIAVQPTFADDRAKILGTWKLISYEAEMQSTGEQTPALGKNPSGYVIFTPEGKIYGGYNGRRTKDSEN